MTPLKHLFQVLIEASRSALVALRTVALWFSDPARAQAVRSLVEEGVAVLRVVREYFMKK